MRDPDNDFVQRIPHRLRRSFLNFFSNKHGGV
jgi:hypothetical protein